MEISNGAKRAGGLIGVREQGVLVENCFAGNDFPCIAYGDFNGAKELDEQARSVKSNFSVYDFENYWDWDETLNELIQRKNGNTINIVSIRYNAENPNKLRPRFYLFFISLTVEAMVIGISTLLSLVAVKYKLRYKSEKEQKRDKTVYYIYVFTTLALLVLIPIVGAFSPLYYF